MTFPLIRGYALAHGVNSQAQKRRLFCLELWGRYPPEKTTSTMVFVTPLLAPPVTALGVQDPHVVLSLSHGQLLSIKTVSWFHLL